MREYRELRNSSEDQERAAPYVGVARTLLGALKNRMRLGGIIQGKDTQRMADGTVITVHSIFGQDEIDIQVPEPKVDTYFRYEFILVTDIFTSIKFLSTTHTITPRSIASKGTDAGFDIIDNDVGGNPFLPLFSQYQNIWYNSKYGVVASGTSIVRYAVKGNRGSTPTLVDNTMRYITIDSTVESPAGSEVIAAAKQGDYLVGITTLGVVVAWKIGEAGYTTLTPTLPSWVDTSQPAFWAFNKAGTKAISTQYAASSGGWRESGYVELNISVDAFGIITATIGRSKRASEDTRPIVAADYDYTSGTDVIVYATLTKEYDDSLPATVFSKYIEIYADEALVDSFLIETQYPDYYAASDGVGWFGNVTAMDLRYRAYTWGYSQEHFKSGPDATIAATSKARVKGNNYADSDLFVSADVALLEPVEIRGVYPFTLQELEGFVPDRIKMTNAFALALHSTGAWSFYTDFTSSFSAEEVKSSLDIVHIPVVDGPDIATTHRALYDSARITTPSLPEITTDWGTVAMGAASVWVQLRSRP